MDALRLLIREKVLDGRLPVGPMPRVWGGPGNGEPIRNDRLIIEAISTRTNHGLQFHVGCFYVWDQERDASGRLDHVRRPKAP